MLSDFAYRPFTVSDAIFLGGKPDENYSNVWEMWRILRLTTHRKFEFRNTYELKTKDIR